MKYRLSVSALALAITISLAAADAPTPSPLDRADELFKSGSFAEAEAIYAKENPAKTARAALRLGQIALFRNRLADAQRWARTATELAPDDVAAKKLLADAYYRADDFPHAAPAFRAIGAEATAKKLESFGTNAPYVIEGPAETKVKFEQTDPLPVIHVKINGKDEVNFIIDTGAGEIVLDDEYAASLGVPDFGATVGTFAGGAKAPTHHGRIDSITLGDMVIRNVPVSMASTKRMSAAAMGKPVSGILGTVALTHFLTTFDYPSGELVLRRKTKENLKLVDAAAATSKATVVPMFEAGDHYMVAWGRVNDSEPMLFFVDTGLAGGGFICPQSTVERAKLEVGDQLGQGVGGGGTVKVAPFVVRDLSLGDAHQKGINGFFGPFPPTLEYAHGFRIGGLISHGFFRRYAVTFDFDGMRLLLAPRAVSLQPHIHDLERAAEGGAVIPAALPGTATAPASRCAG
jgi:hypothetical protein